MSLSNPQAPCHLRVSGGNEKAGHSSHPPRLPADTQLLLRATCGPGIGQDRVKCGLCPVTASLHGAGLHLHPSPPPISSHAPQGSLSSKPHPRLPSSQNGLSVFLQRDFEKLPSKSPERHRHHLNLQTYGSFIPHSGDSSSAAMRSLARGQRAESASQPCPLAQTFAHLPEPQYLLCKLGVMAFTMKGTMTYLWW